MRHHRSSFQSGLLLAALLTATPAARAGLSPESVALVVNGDSWASLTVANEYAALRRIPARNVILLHGLTAPVNQRVVALVHAIARGEARASRALLDRLFDETR